MKGENLSTTEKREMTDAVAAEFDQAHGPDVEAESLGAGIIQVIIGPDHDDPVKIADHSSGALGVRSVTVNTRYADSSGAPHSTQTLEAPSTVIEADVDLNQVSERFDQ